MATIADRVAEILVPRFGALAPPMQPPLQPAVDLGPPLLAQMPARHEQLVPPLLCPQPGPELLPGPTAEQRRLWLRDLREQLPSSTHFGLREREEARGLLIIGEGAGPPMDDAAWFWGRVRFYIIIAHHGWGAAIADARRDETKRLGIEIEAAFPPPAFPTQQLHQRARRGRGPSGLRQPRPAATAAAPKQEN